MIVHLCPLTDWRAAQERGDYRAASLEQAGFIHFSRPEQMLQVANYFYQGMTDLVLLWVEPDKLEAELRWEDVEGSTFPHLYGALNLDAVMAVTDFPPDADGVFRQEPHLPPDFGAWACA